MRMTGTTLLDRPIKVNHSKNPIVKPAVKIDEHEKAFYERKLKAAQEAISNKLIGEYYYIRIYIYYILYIYLPILS